MGLIYKKILTLKINQHVSLFFHHWNKVTISCLPFFFEIVILLRSDYIKMILGGAVSLSKHLCFVSIGIVKPWISSSNVLLSL